MNEFNYHSGLPPKVERHLLFSFKISVFYVK